MGLIISLAASCSVECDFYLNQTINVKGVALLGSVFLNSTPFRRQLRWLMILISGFNKGKTVSPLGCAKLMIDFFSFMEKAAKSKAVPPPAPLADASYRLS